MPSRRSGAFGAFAQQAASGPTSPGKGGAFSKMAAGGNGFGSKGSIRPAPELTIEEVRDLLEELRTVCSGESFQKDLSQLRSLDWGAFKKREAVAKLLSIFWKAPLKKKGFGIDGCGFRNLLEVVKSHAERPGVRVVSHEVERKLCMIPGTLFGLKASTPGESRSWKEVDAQKAKPEPKTPQAQAAAPTSVVTPVKSVRNRAMFLGEAKEILKAFREALMAPGVDRTMKNLEERGGPHFEKNKRFLITQEWNPIMKRFDFPISEAGYEAMKEGIRAFADNEYIQNSCHQIERLCGVLPGAYFGVASPEEAAAKARAEKERLEEEAKRKAQEAEAARKALEEKRRAEEERRKAKEAEEAKAKEEAEKAEEEAKKRAEEEQEAKRRAEEEAKMREEEEAKKKAEEEAKQKEEDPRLKQQDEEERKRTEELQKLQRMNELDKAWASGLFDFADTEPDSDDRRDEKSSGEPEQGSSEEAGRIQAAETDTKAEEEVRTSEIKNLEDEKETKKTEEEESRARDASEKSTTESETGDAEKLVETASAKEHAVEEELPAEVKMEEEKEEEAVQRVEESTAKEDNIYTAIAEKATDREDARIEENTESATAERGEDGEDATGEAKARGPEKTTGSDEAARSKSDYDAQFASEKAAAERTALFNFDDLDGPSGAAGVNASAPKVSLPADLQWFQVVHDRIGLREHPAAEAKLVGAAKRGQHLLGKVSTVESEEWLQVSEHSCKEIGALADKAWALLNGSRLGLGELLRLSIEQLPTPLGNAGRFKVVHTQVAVRATPSMDGNIVGVVHQDRMLMGTPHLVGGQTWVRFEAGARKKIAASGEEAWALIDGQALGLGQLLKPLDTDAKKALEKYLPDKEASPLDAELPAAAPPPAAAVKPSTSLTPVASPASSAPAEIAPATSSAVAAAPTSQQVPASSPPAESAAKVVTSSASAAPTSQAAPSTAVDPVTKVASAQKAVDQVRQVLSGPLEYVVVGTDKPAAVRVDPLVSSKELGQLAHGTAVLGYPAVGWLQLASGNLLDAKLVGGWVYVGMRLAPRWAEITVHSRFAEALEVSWPGLKEPRIAYSVEWRSPESAARQLSGHKITKGPKAVVSGLPPGSAVRLRVAARVLTERSSASPQGVHDKDVSLYGCFYLESPAAAIPESLEEMCELDRDPFGQERGSCASGLCWSYVATVIDPEDEFTSHSMTVNQPAMVCCKRCGLGHAQHIRAQESTADLARWPLATYEVLHSAVFVRGSRSTKGTKIGALRKGNVVRGRREGSWLRLGPEAMKTAAAGTAGSPEVAGWVLVDGSSLGLGELLAPVQAKAVA
eukprot:TRINITY_DN1704_c0_g2_i1.p1 TRINITY_DN1704_c0_g2~~TRINITY_DN1704_c0_g2_i1.p1  ORF type:complete len:1333 (+),score=381.45 TRINITY_DN1704_c0_g2_i1:44-4000(+)